MAPYSFSSDVDMDIQLYTFLEGNYSCDCNRAVFFAETRNEEIEHAVNLPCSQGKYSCLYALLETGEKISIDKVYG